MKQDIEIARETPLEPIEKIAEKLGIPKEKLELYGKYKAKIDLEYCFSCRKQAHGKLILVTATNPTPAGEGKTTTSIGLSDALNRLGKKSTVVLREPSLGPVFGIKGGATGGGYSQCVPMEDINLHFTGDMHAITAAHNTLAALLNNAIFRGKIDMDPKRILWNRVLDVNDRALRHIIVGLGSHKDGVTHESSFDITAASEIMAILCLSHNILDLKEKINNILLGFTRDGKPIYVKHIGVAGAIAALLKDAIKPNLVQTLEHNPAIIHGGPFANIAQGTNSIIATDIALRLSDYVVTEAGFGSDLGAEKFFDLVSPTAQFHPDIMVLVTTIRALKMHGGAQLNRIKKPDLVALEKGLANLGKHLENSKKFGMDCIVAVNKFASDSDEEIELVINYCKALGYDVALSEVWEHGGKGGEELAKKIIKHLETQNNEEQNTELQNTKDTKETKKENRSDNPKNIDKVQDKEKAGYHPLYSWNLPIKNKIQIIAKEIYGAADVEYLEEAEEDLKTIEALKLNKLPICMAKTQKSLSDDAKLLGAPKGFTLKIRRILIAAGAGFLIPLTGKILRMPGLPAKPAAESIDIDYDGDLVGLF